MIHDAKRVKWTLKANQKTGVLFYFIIFFYVCGTPLVTLFSDNEQGDLFYPAG